MHFLGAVLGLLLTASAVGVAAEPTLVAPRTTFTAAVIPRASGGERHSGPLSVDGCAGSAAHPLDAARPAAAVGESGRPQGFTEFWPGDLTRLDIYIPAKPTLEEQSAALSLAAFAARLGFGHAVTVKVQPLDPEQVLPSTPGDEGSRVVLIRRAAATETRLLHDIAPWPVLLVSAVAGQLADAVDTLVGVAGAAASSRAPRQQWSFAELGHHAVRLGGGRGTEAHIRFAQADVGGPVGAVGLRLVGTHTGTPPGTRLLVSVNGGVVRSIPLAGTGRFDFYSDVPGSLLVRDNQVTVRLSGALLPEDCGATPVPFVVEVDGSSSVQLRPGQTLALGFQRFPQVLLPEFEVSVDDGSAAGLGTAAQVVAALQRATHTPLRPRVVAWDTGRAGHRAWLAIARRPESTRDLPLPLKPAPFRLLAGNRSELLRLGPDSRFAELVVATVHGRDALVVTHRDWPEGVTALGSALATTRGWFALTGDAWIVPDDSLPFAMQVAGAGIEMEPLTRQPLAPWWDRARQAAFGVVSIGMMLLLVLAYPRVVRERSPLDRSNAHAGSSPSERVGPEGGNQ